MASAKRARKDKEKEKAFEDHTVAELRDLAKQVESKEETISDLKEEISELKEAGRGLGDDDIQAERIKTCISKQFMNQMVLEKDLSEKEGERMRGAGGKDVLAIVPNVAQGVLSALGLDKVDEKGAIKGKNADQWFSSLPLKTLPGGATLRLLRSVTFKYVKSSGELKATAAYRWLPKPKPKVPRKRKAEGEVEVEGAAADGAAAGGAAADGAGVGSVVEGEGGGEDLEEDREEDGGKEDAEGADVDDVAEAEAEAEVSPSKPPPPPAVRAPTPQSARREICRPGPEASPDID